MKRRIKISNNGNKIIIMFDIVIVLGVKIKVTQFFYNR